MPAVGEVEALVDQGEVRDLLAAQGQGEAEPVVEGRVHQLVAAEAALAVGHRQMQHLAPPALHQGDAEAVRGEGAQGGGPGIAGAFRQALKGLLEDDGQSLAQLNFPTASSPMADISNMLETLTLRLNRNRYSTIANELLLGIFEGFEYVFDGTTAIPGTNIRPDYTGYSAVVQLSRLDQSPSPAPPVKTVV